MGTKVPVRNVPRTKVPANERACERSPRTKVPGNESFILLYKSVGRPHLEYANSVWCPCKQGDIKELEKIQKKLLNW